MKKVFVIDTNILLTDPNSLFKFSRHDVVIPISVIEEIDVFKKDQSETGRNAREVSRILDRLRKKGNLASGIPLSDDPKNEGLLFVYLGRDLTILPSLLRDITDNAILAVALTLQKKFGETRKVILITKDSNLRVKADALAISSEDFEADKVDVSQLYTGMCELEVEANVINELYARSYVENPLSLTEFPLYANQFLTLKNPANDIGQGVLARYNKKQNSFELLQNNQEKVWGVSPRNKEQNFGLAALLDDKIKLVTLTGGAGTGKTLLAIAAGLSKTTDEDIYNKVLIARPVFPLGKDIGFLPGSVDEKLNPWMQPIYDNLDLLLNGAKAARQKRLNKNYQELIDQGLLCVEPLTYIRGRSLPHCFFLVDEAQNLTPHEIKTIITRAGEGTKIVLTGDPFQIDNPYVDSTNNGLTHVVERFKDSEIAAHITYSKGERSELASLAVRLL